MSQYVDIDTTAARYWEFMVHNFMDGLITSQRDLSNHERNLSEDDLEAIYARGYNFFTSGKYEAAKDVFTGLTDYAPRTAHYWRALGAVNQQLKHYDKAIAAYDMAIANDERDIVSYVYRGESQILSERRAEGLSDFEAVLEGFDATDPQFALWVQRAELLLSRHRQS